MGLIGSDSRLTTLSGSDERVETLTGGDARVASLTGGDRLMPDLREVEADGGAELATLEGEGSATTGLIVSGAAALAEMAALGSSRIASKARSAAAVALSALIGAGYGTVPLASSGGAEFSYLEASGAATMLPLSAAGAWFRTANAVNAGSGLPFTLPNELSAFHATTSINSVKPTLGTSANGYPILICSADNLVVALHAAINSSTKFWIAFHCRITSAAGNPVPFSIDSAGGGGASNRKLVAQRFVGDRVHVFNAASTLSRAFGSTTTLWPLNVWVHVICELNTNRESSPGVLAPEADRGLWCVDGLPITSTFSNSTGSPGVLTSSMPTPTGNLCLLSQAFTTGGNGWVGEIGPNIMIGAQAMSGATRGCLLPATRLALSAFQRPTS